MTDNLPRLIAKLTRTKKSDRLNVLSKSLDRMIRDVLKIPADTDLNYDAPFSELGLSSVAAIKLANEILENIGEEYEFTATKLFEYTSVNKLTSYLATQIKIAEL